MFKGFIPDVLVPGDEVRVIKGLETKLYKKPCKVVVEAEYSNHYLLKAIYKVTHKYPRKDLEIRMCVDKPSMLCGDVVLERVFDGKVLTGSAVNHIVNKAR